MTNPMTLWDAGAERRAEHAEWERVDGAAKAESDRIAAILSANPQIGELCREGRRVFYVCPTPGAYIEHDDPAKLIS